MISTFS